MSQDIIQQDPWASLKQFTTARIALGRTGTAIPLREVLNFRLAHAHARDAVYSALAVNALQEQLHAFYLPIVLLHSRAVDRYEYLQRPDKGRQLDAESISLLKSTAPGYLRKDVAIILADGLSATAMNVHTQPLLEVLIPLLKGAGLSLAPICIVQQGRVASGDEAGEILQAKVTLMLIGERPGLSAADSMGAYITFGPKPGITDESRNCISNIREEGLQYEAAAQKILYLIKEAIKLKLTGVALKDNTGLLE
ncbi:ethanolamine ammonia-lyase subunit EutC [Chitinophaga sancti]|uniref:Ethanolamine ammonia-lyase small subunit n=1 Tax=Chitinophaga sancti TaxID=1004 RepID=A0A1K1M3S7_9BACT|nr:ethanolamine ammonia-lyase subunit EutC [Chitinophaga sancti]WQD64656.1 ethanolamine ammonia-lyase subunit EutC [Chitinophaga sancti]WQG89722.1 ethanolamine ammonia-lyase subunit EutC [Chitinophaga sancti]SFW17768.1 Ethanolamine ammonia-lyase light chain [Chitinophaga sancti]